MKFINNYIENIVNYDFLNKFNYSSIEHMPEIKKIHLNFNSKTTILKYLLAALVSLELITLQKSVFTYAKNTNILFKVKKGSPIGCTIVLRKTKMILFLSELLINVLPKIKVLKQFCVKNSKIFSFKVKNILLFYELEKRYQFFNKVNNLNITIVTNSKTRNELIFLLNSIKIN